MSVTNKDLILDGKMPNINIQRHCMKQGHVLIHVKSEIFQKMVLFWTTSIAKIRNQGLLGDNRRPQGVF